MDIEIQSTKRIYQSPPGINVKKSEKHFASRKVKYKVIDEEGNEEIKRTFIPAKEVGINSGVDKIREFLIQKENTSTNDFDEEIITEAE